MPPSFCRVFVDSPVLALDRPFDYEIPERLAGRVQAGSVVRVPLHGRRVRAFATELLDFPAVPHPRPLSALVSSEPLFTSDELALARWTADRYVVSMGSVLHEAVPGRYSPSRASARRSAKRTGPPAWLASPLPSSGECVVVSPGPDDEVALLAHAAGEAGRALVVCPRVDVAERIAAATGAAMVHSDLRPAERAASWSGARKGDVPVVVGGRAALFVPMPDLRLVAVASAHDPPLRSERSPRLHALVVARRRAAARGAAFLASSPSPPLELWADEGVRKIGSTRRSALRVEVARPRGGPVTPRLLDVVRSAVEKGRDAFVFVGRVGGVLRLRCTDCGWFPRCPRCAVGLTIAEEGRLRCRMCGTQTQAPEECAACGGALLGRGWGHARVAQALEREGPDAPVLRFAATDVPTTTADHGGRLAAHPEPAVVVGTLAAAHRWPRPFGSVAVADLDQLLARPDFRASEQALRTLYEAAAALEAGGRFLVQTREPEHHVVQAFTRQSYRYFAERELERRREAGYPPYGEIAVVEGDESALHELERDLVKLGARVTGPLEGRRGGARMLVRARDVAELSERFRAFALANPRSRVEVDPVDVL